MAILLETKKKLRKDIDYLFRLISDLNIRIGLMEQKERQKEDIISGRECAHMLGWSSDSIKSEYLKKLGIEFTLDERGYQKISKQSVIAYLAKKEDQDQ